MRLHERHKGALPPLGTTVTGMVKSYNMRGFGFIMCQGIDQDIYFSRDSMHPHLFEIHPRASDLAGEAVNFEIHRFPDGKLQARNLRAVGDPTTFRSESSSSSKGKGGKCGKGCKGPPRDDEDRGRDWFCTCGALNPVSRPNCFKCQAPCPRIEGEISTNAGPPPRRNLSPHAGSRAMREMYKKGQLSRSRSSSKKGKKQSKRRRSKSNSTSSTSSSSTSRTKKKKKKKKSKRRCSRSRSTTSRSSRSVSSRSSSSCLVSGCTGASANPAGGPNSGLAPRAHVSTGKGSPEIDKAKAEALDKLMKLKSVEPKDARMKEWRALLREWHPDKNPDRVEVATAVFQFLQKGKLILDTQ